MTWKLPVVPLSFFTPAWRAGVCILVCVGANLLGAQSVEAARRKNADAAKIDSLYDLIGSQSERYEQGIGLWLEGNQSGAKAHLEGARKALTEAAKDCAAIKDCDAGRFVVAIDRLLKKGNQAMLAQAGAQLIDTEDDSAVVAPDADVAHASDHTNATSPVLTQFPNAQRTLSLLHGQELSNLIEMNGPVKASMEEWLTWMRPYLLDANEHYQYMRHLMWPAYQEAGLPEALLFGFVAKESGGKVHAVSRAGASGPLQFMPATGRRYGLGGDGTGFDTRFDAAAAARANAAYFNEQFGILNRDLEMVLAAYNGGEGRAARLSGNGARTFWQPEVYWSLPPETRDYVPMVLAAAWLYLHPKTYGLEFPVIDATPAQIQLSGDISLNELSVCLGQVGNPRGWFRTLRNLNPRHDPNLRLAAGNTLNMPKLAAEAYATRCVNSPLASTAFDLHQSALPSAPARAVAQYTPSGKPKAQKKSAKPSKTHTVRNGETLYAIARRYGCGMKDLAKANQLKAPGYAIRKGQRLKVGTCGA